MMFKQCIAHQAIHNNLLCILHSITHLLGIIIVTEEEPPVEVQLSVTPFSVVSDVRLPLKVIVELRHKTSLLLLSVKVTPLTVDDGRDTIAPTTTRKSLANTKLLQVRSLSSLLQV